jgi:hypothetical protein
VNRAELLLSVLADGRPHSRHEVFERVGFMLTNNAASELRARGYDVEHKVDGGLHTYHLASLLEGGAPNERASGPEQPAPAVETSVASPVPQAGRRPEPASPPSSGDAHHADAASSPEYAASVVSSPRDAAPDSPTQVPGQLSILGGVA